MGETYQKALMILKAVRALRGGSVQEIQDHIRRHNIDEMPYSTCREHLLGLKALGLVRREANERNSRLTYIWYETDSPKR